MALGSQKSLAETTETAPVPPGGETSGDTTAFVLATSLLGITNLVSYRTSNETVTCSKVLSAEIDAQKD